MTSESKPLTVYLILGTTRKVQSDVRARLTQVLSSVEWHNSDESHFELSKILPMRLDALTWPQTFAMIEGMLVITLQLHEHIL